MAKLYTKTGDDGTTGLFDGSRVAKDDLRVCAYGDVDELNAQIGLAISLMGERGPTLKWQGLLDRLSAIQHGLFTLGAELATPRPAAGQVPQITTETCVRLERWIDDASAATTPLREFVLPGGSVVSSQLHICRTVCRRAERSVVLLAKDAELNPQLVIYLNRLSDLLFAWARESNTIAGVADVPWKK